jgi:hypothetical protein
MTEHEMTRELRRLVCLIAEATKSNNKYGALAIKDLSLKGLINKGILTKALDYDYAPASIMYLENRRYINISQEAEDDLGDLRDLKLINRVRLATKSHAFIYAYQLTDKGIKFLESIPKEDKEAVEPLVKCKNGHNYDIKITSEGIFFICEKCNIKIDSEITDIEEVAYKSIPVKIKTPLTKLKDVI